MCWKKKIELNPYILDIIICISCVVVQPREFAKANLRIYQIPVFSFIRASTENRRL